MNMLQLTSLPLYVSPFFNSMSIGWFSAVFNNVNGSMLMGRFDFVEICIYLLTRGTEFHPFLRQIWHL